MPQISGLVPQLLHLTQQAQTLSLLSAVGPVASFIPSSFLTSFKPSNFLTPSPILSFQKYSLSSTMGSIPAAAPLVKVLIAGGSYAGLSAALNLLDLGRGLSPRMAYEPYTHHSELPNVDFQVTIVDERDGFCMLFSTNFIHFDVDLPRR